MIRFSDGVNIDISGELRLVKLKDCYYITGQGLLVPVDSSKKGQETIKELESA